MLRTRMRPVFFVLLLSAVFATACVALPDPIETAVPTTEPPAKKQGPAENSTAARMTAITGNVVYRQRIALAPDAVVEVKLQDISRADAPAELLGEQRIEANGQQVPIPFVVEYDLSRIDPRGVYALSASITEGGKLTWHSTEVIRVITDGWPTDQVEILVQQLGN